MSRSGALTENVLLALAKEARFLFFPLFQQKSSNFQHKYVSQEASIFSLFSLKFRKKGLLCWAVVPNNVVATEASLAPFKLGLTVIHP